MTLILASVAGNTAFQVGDRLVTKESREFDPVSNKQIVYCAPSGSIAIGYSGTAFLGETHTDRWIAEQLRGHSLPPGTDFLIKEISGKTHDICQAIVMLCDALDEIWPTLCRSQKDLGLSLIITGWHKLERKQRQLPAQVIGLDDQKRVIIKRSSRGRYRPVLCRVNRIDGAFCRTFHRVFQTLKPETMNSVFIDEKALNVRLTQARQNNTREQYLRDMVQEVQRIGGIKNTVGQNCLSVEMRWEPPNRITEIQSHLVHPVYKQADAPRSGFVAMNPILVDMPTPEHPLEPPKSPPSFDGLEVSYTPWIVWPEMVIPPSAVIGNFLFGPSYAKVRIIGPPSQDSIFAGFLAQKRLPRTKQ